MANRLYGREDSRIKFCPVGLVVKALDCQSRDHRFKSGTGRMDTLTIKEALEFLKRDVSASEPCMAKLLEIASCDNEGVECVWYTCPVHLVEHHGHSCAAHSERVIAYLIVRGMYLEKG